MNLSLDLIPTNEAKIDTRQANIHIVQIICDDLTIKSAYWVDNAKLPIIQANINVKRPKLMVWPIVLMVACEAEAVGASLGGTELIIAFIFGLEKRPIPIPCKIIARITRYNGVSLFRKVNISNATVAIAIPAAASFCGWILSESLPVFGARIAMIIGVTINTIPAIWAFHPLTYWK